MHLQQRRRLRLPAAAEPCCFLSFIVCQTALSPLCIILCLVFVFVPNGFFAVAGAAA
jgi:hypothetical protein